MTGFFLPDVMMARAAKRLHAMASAIENGMTLTDVAAQFRIPIAALRRVAAPPPRKPPVHAKPAITRRMLATAAKRIREGANYRIVAADLNVNASTMIKALTRIGVTMTSSRAEAGAAKIDRALDLYQQGQTISSIRDQTGVAGTTLYKHLKMQPSVVLRQTHQPHPRRRP